MDATFTHIVSALASAVMSMAPYVGIAARQEAVAILMPLVTALNAWSAPNSSPTTQPSGPVASESGAMSSGIDPPPQPPVEIERGEGGCLHRCASCTQMCWRKRSAHHRHECEIHSR